METNTKTSMPKSIFIYIMEMGCWLLHEDKQFCEEQINKITCKLKTVLLFPSINKLKSIVTAIQGVGGINDGLPI